MNIEPGPDTDRKVAEAIGHDCNPRSHDWQEVPCGDSTEGTYCCSFCGDYASGDDVRSKFPDLAVGECSPEFSTDLNAAFHAAEKVGLFHGAWLTQNNNTDGWSVCDDDESGMPTDDETCTEATTPALAICAAVLELAKAEE